MAVSPLATITYTGNLVAAQVQSSPWDCYGLLFPDTGTMPYNPQYESEVLQPEGLDSARYRAGGAHFPPFHMRTIMGATDFENAGDIGRDIELVRGDYISVNFYLINQTLTLYVKNVKAMPNVKGILGATLSSNQLQGFNVGIARASIDTSWEVQVVGP
jgi:hypothetical protein